MKYLNRTAITEGQEAEAFPLLDAALALPFGKAIFHKCTRSRAGYLQRLLTGEIYRNAIQSISAYLPTEPLYGRGLYYHIVVETRQQGVVIAHLENPLTTVTWLIIKCAATRKPVGVQNFSQRTIQSRLNKLKERHPELKHVYYDNNINELRYAIPNTEELIVVDIDTNERNFAPTLMDRAKIGQ